MQMQLEALETGKVEYVAGGGGEKGRREYGREDRSRKKRRKGTEECGEARWVGGEMRGG